jgi:hypothetical protein
MIRRSIVVAMALGALACGALSAVPPGKAQELAFETPEGAQAFEDGKAAFLEKKAGPATERFVKARKAAKNKPTQQEVDRWIQGLKGLADLEILERNLEKEPGWAYENAQRKLLVHIATPAAEFFRQLIERIEDSEKKIVVKFEGFEDRARVYDARFGHNYVSRTKEPAHVIEGEQSLKWECVASQDKSRVFRVKDGRVPKDWSQYDFLGFWMYGVEGMSSRVEVCLTNERDQDPAKGAKGKGGATVRHDGFQVALQPHEGWRFVTISLKEAGKGSASFRKVGAGDLSKVGGLQFQLPAVKKFAAYLDNFVLIKGK